MTIVIVHYNTIHIRTNNSFFNSSLKSMTVIGFLIQNDSTDIQNTGFIVYIDTHLNIQQLELELHFYQLKYLMFFTMPFHYDS